MNRRAFLGLGVLAGVGACAPSFPALRLTIATGSKQGAYYPLGTALADAWRDELRLTATPVVSSTGGSVENLRLLAGRNADVAFSQIDIAADQSASVDPTDPASPRALARIYDDVAQVVVRADSPIRSLTQLRGSRVGVGASGSGVFVVAQRMLQAVHLSATADVQPFYLDLAGSVRALREGRVDAFFWVGALPTKGVGDLAAALPIRLLDLELDDVLRAIRTIWPIYAPGTVPTGSYGSTTPVTTLFVRNVLVVRAEMPDGVAHDLVKALFARQAAIARVSPNALTIDLRAAIGTQPVRLHPGAEAWFREARDGS